MSGWYWTQMPMFWWDWVVYGVLLIVFAPSIYGWWQNERQVLRQERRRRDRRRREQAEKDRRQQERREAERQRRERESLAAQHRRETGSGGS